MTAIHGLTWLDRISDLADRVAPALADAAVKGAAILLVAWVATLAMRRASASARHWVWMLAVLSLPLLPVISALLPGWRVLPRWLDVGPPPVAEARGAPAPIIAPRAEDLARVTTPRALLPIGPARATNAPIATPEEPFQTAPTPMASPTKAIQPVVPTGSDRRRAAWRWLLLTWSSGSALALLPLLLGVIMLWRLERSSRRVDDPAWNELLAPLTRELGRRVTLLSSQRRSMPMTWGILRPKLLLPDEAGNWPAQRRRAVLLHELAHVRRWDCLWQLLTQVTCAAYWFNPLLWMAARKMHAERERACDDLVLLAGTAAPDYAQELLQIASGLQSDLFAGYSAIAMARPSSLEGRLLAVLDPSRNRRALTRAGTCMAVLLVAAVVLPTAMIRAGADKDAARSAPEEKPAKPRENTAPVTARYVDLQGGKPPMRYYVADLTLVNRRDVPVWFVFRYWEDEPLDDGGGRIGGAERGGGHDPLEGEEYDGKNVGGRGRVVVIKDVGHFRAIHVPSGGTIGFDRFQAQSSSPVQTLDVWEVDSLKVNGTTPVEKWLPYETISDSNVHITNAKDHPTNLDWDPATSRNRADLPSEKVRFVEGKVLAKWMVPIVGLDERTLEGPRSDRASPTTHPDVVNVGTYPGFPPTSSGATTLGSGELKIQPNATQPVGGARTTPPGEEMMIAGLPGQTADAGIPPILPAPPAAPSTGTLERSLEEQLSRFAPSGYPDRIAAERIAVQDLAAHAVLLRSTRWELKSSPQSGVLSTRMQADSMKLPETERLKVMDRIDDYVQLWAVAGTVNDPVALKQSLKVTDKPHLQHREVFFLGRAAGRTYFGYMPIHDFAFLEQKNALDGEDVLPALIRGMGVEDSGSCTANSCEGILAEQGPKAIGTVDRAVADRLPKRGRIIGAVGQSKDAGVTRWLTGLLPSKDQETAQAARRALLGSPRPEAAGLYEQWLAEGAGRRRVREELLACRAVKAANAKESLAKVLAAPASAFEYRAALEFSHELDGKPPMPDALADAERQVEHFGYASGPDFNQAKVDRGVEAILATPDPRDAAAVGLALALFVIKGDTRPAHDAGVRILQRLPDDAGKRLIELVVEHNQESYQEGALNDLLKALRAGKPEVEKFKVDPTEAAPPRGAGFPAPGPAGGAAPGPRNAATTQPPERFFSTEGIGDEVLNLKTAEPVPADVGESIFTAGASHLKPGWKAHLPEGIGKDLAAQGLPVDPKFRALWVPPADTSPHAYVAGFSNAHLALRISQPAGSYLWHHYQDNIATLTVPRSPALDAAFDLARLEQSYGRVYRGLAQGDSDAQVRRALGPPQQVEPAQAEEFTRYLYENGAVEIQMWRGLVHRIEVRSGDTPGITAPAENAAPATRPAAASAAKSANRLSELERSLTVGPVVERPLKSADEQRRPIDPVFDTLADTAEKLEPWPISCTAMG